MTARPLRDVRVPAIAAAATAVLALALTLAAPADAARVNVTSDGTAVFKGGAKANKLIVSVFRGPEISFKDRASRVTTGSVACRAVKRTVRCPVSALSAIKVLLQGGHDQAVSRGDAVVTMFGGGGHDVLGGGDGDDTLIGGGGNDLISGGRGADEVAGSKGHDRVIGNAGADRMFGNGGNDQLTGGRGRDTIKAGSGIDQVNASPDGAPDRVNCGGGIDFAFIFRRDRARGCEFLKRK